MTKVINLTAETRERAGKGTARATRRTGRIPAVIYGNKEKPLMISLEERGFNKVLHAPGFFTHLFDITVDGAAHRVLPRDVQFHPVSDAPLHVDFLRISSETLITVEIPVHFVNELQSPGLKRGGVLNIIHHTIQVECRADAIPEQIEIDVTGFEVGHSIHISSVKLPEGVTPVDEHDFAIATISAPSGLRSEEAAETPAATTTTATPAA
ncbi:MAG: 50S ribosomal protein L25/general stress protein Ctc [Azospirillaceae bacterium]|nr:50S ribosomal protein L25/general stress protein Ctc [Azospirillaceae bacterium]